MSAPPRFMSRSEAAVIRQHIDALIENEHEVRGVLVSTGDGFQVASNLPPELSEEKLSAMASSMLAINEAVCRETALGNCRDLIIEASAGRILLMDIPHPAHKLVLTVLCHAKVAMGQVWWSARGCRESLARIFQTV